MLIPYGLGVLLIRNRQSLTKTTTHAKERLLVEANNSTTRSHGYQKLMLYYNDHSAWIMFIK